MNNKDIFVGFISNKLKQQFETLKDERLYQFIDRAIDDLKQNPSCGVKIQKRLWPKEYKKFGISNLWKYNLPNAWRIIYTIETDEEKIMSVILEWFSHKDYEKRFKY